MCPVGGVRENDDMVRRQSAGVARPFMVPLAGLAAAIALVSSSANAHFKLVAPASWMSQDSLGSPQKTGPCGNEAGGTATGTVTAYKPGDTVTITVSETIFHPGHYRVALAAHAQSELPPEPTVTPGATACGSVPVQNPPVFPVLADGVLEHQAAFSGPQTITVKLPTNVTCDKCTLQVLEFMSDHGAPCFYHHCAEISIGDGSTDGGSSEDAAPSSDASAVSDASADPGDASTEEDSSAAGGDGGTASGGSRRPSATNDGSGGGCSTALGDRGALAQMVVFGFVGAALVRRRRARTSRS
jgi:hypothetical protein